MFLFFGKEEGEEKRILKVPNLQKDKRWERKEKIRKEKKSRRREEREETDRG